MLAKWKQVVFQKWQVNFFKLDWPILTVAPIETKNRICFWKKRQRAMFAAVHLIFIKFQIFNLIAQ